MAGEGAAAAVLQALVQNLIDVSKNEISLIRGFDGEAQKLTLNLLTIQQFLNDAETQTIPTGAVKIWLKRLENAAFEADNVLDELHYHSLSPKHSTGRKRAALKQLEGASKDSDALSKAWISFHCSEFMIWIKLSSSNLWLVVEFCDKLVSQREMGSEGPKSVRINVTGFKKFQGVSENPSEVIVNNLRDYVDTNGLLPAGVNLGICTVLEKAGDGAVSELYKVLDLGINNTRVNETVVWVHLGVNNGVLKFSIERQAVNEATFCCLDELGWQPQQIPILLGDGGISSSRQTSCSPEAILELVKAKGYDAIVSHDAGRFVCNFVYYHSLRFAEEKGHTSIFVHLPPFSRVDEETQMQFIVALFESIASTC